MIPTHGRGTAKTLRRSVSIVRLHLALTALLKAGTIAVPDLPEYAMQEYDCKHYVTFDLWHIMEGRTRFFAVLAGIQCEAALLDVEHFDPERPLHRIHSSRRSKQTTDEPC